MVFQQKLLEKAYFIIKLTGQAMVWPASSWQMESSLSFIGMDSFAAYAYFSRICPLEEGVKVMENFRE